MNTGEVRLARSWVSRYATIEGKRTHYLEAGKGDPLVLLHSGEFGACAEFTWEFNIDGLAEHFHVFAPDWLGYGKSEKLFSFESMWELRTQHIAALVRHLGIDGAHFIGSSMGGTVLAGVAALDDGRWPIRCAVLVSGGGFVPENGPRSVLTDYDGSLDHMRRIYRVLFRNPAVRDNEAMILRHHRASLEPGAWECTAAPRFKAPVRPKKPFAPAPPDYSRVSVPVLIMAGRDDNLREPNYGEQLQQQIPGSQLVTLDGGHCHQIDMPEIFNMRVLDYLLSKAEPYELNNNP
jgi:2-hydroxymuconate-semialdehyde hydrolase